MNPDHSDHRSPNRQRTISRFIFFGFVAVALFYLITEHRAHLFGVLPFLLLAACPLMHLFHHGGGHKHGEGDGGDDASNSKPSDPGSGHQHG